MLDQRRRKMYMESLKAQGNRMAESQVKAKEQRRARALREKGLTPPAEDAEKIHTPEIDPVIEDETDPTSLDVVDDDALYDAPATSARVSLRGGVAQPGLFITPTTSQGLLPTPPSTPSPGPLEEGTHILKADAAEPEQPSPNAAGDFQESPTTAYPSKGRLSIRDGASQIDVVASASSQPLVTISPPRSYSLFAYLHRKGYFLSPGLRFGCQYLVYPGDPLRFHSHFLASGVGWDEEMNLMDIVGGGRLGDWRQERVSSRRL